MPKSRTRKPKNKNRATGPVERRRRRIEKLIDAVAVDYSAWAAGELGAEEELEVKAFSVGQLAIVKIFYVFLDADDRPSAGLRIDPQGVPDALDALLDTDDVDQLRYLIGTLIDWVTFLEETERWEGTAAELEALTELLDAEAEAVGGIVDAAPGELGAPRREPTEEEALEFATASPLVRHALAVLNFVGDGRAVDADGELVGAEFIAMAALVGSDSADARRRLSRLWRAMVNAEILEIDGGAGGAGAGDGGAGAAGAGDGAGAGAGDGGVGGAGAGDGGVGGAGAGDGGVGQGATARPGEDAARLGTGDVFGRLEAQFLATEFVIATCESAGEGPQGESVGGGLAAILQRAAVDDPLELAAVESLAADAPDGADPAALEVVSVLLLDELRELAALGIVDLRKGFADVHAAALDAVYDAFEAPDGEDFDEEDWAD
ncbi:hypothetical protein [Sinomonas sp. ASV322]|uniref:hypothetical protein n=1 Tax=Sinomonas sp. ASV322 TaxID=3041920 RepID=UPI0027DD202E|nr:hypothetical protein [Sinomonas sp. ASV322]MDQ4503395.1 hypothetical protein [Sinomonas sp. ASV322]